MARNKWSKKLLLAAAVAAMACCQSAFAETVEMDLEDAMLRAFNTNPAVEIAGYEMKSAKASYDAARSARYLNIGFDHSTGRGGAYEAKSGRSLNEDIRVRTMNALECVNRLINYIITFMSITNSNNSSLSKVIIKVAKSIKENVYLNYYRIRYGITIILSKVIYKTKVYIDNVNRNINYVLKKAKEQPTLFNFGMF